ncbi:hypothetical protein NL676_033372 [Syzygium grande]|nr:hypothetical protein NL676_033372 [Syzygium grande]
MVTSRIGIVEPWPRNHVRNRLWRLTAESDLVAMVEAKFGLVTMEPTASNDGGVAWVDLKNDGANRELCRKGRRLWPDGGAPT